MEDLKAERAASGEVIAFPSLKIYEHHCDDPTKAETTIFVGLQPKAD